ncbi:MAG: hypothetical protein EOM47_08005 [Bacteroidia bacterium]|nr:hypothetical protein [Bacteroidia bacterium]
MKNQITVLTVFCLFSFNVYSQSVKYFRSFSEDKRNCRIKFINSVDTSILRKTECYRVTFDKTNRPVQIEKLRHGKPLANIGEQSILKIEYKGFIEKRMFCERDMNNNIYNCFTESIQRLNDKNRIIVRELDANGKPVSRKYSIVLYTLDSQKNIIKKQYVNDDLKPILFSDSSSHTIYNWSENKNLLTHTSTTYFGFKDKLKSEKLNKKAVEIIDLNTNRVLKRSVSYIGGDKGLIAKKDYKYDLKGNLVCYYDSVIGRFVTRVIQFECKYNKYGNSTESLHRCFYSRSNSALAHLEDAVYREECDSLGLVTRITRLKNEFKAVDSDYCVFPEEMNPYGYRYAYLFKNECASIEFKYDNNLNKIAEFYYDNNNNLLSKGVCSVKYVYDNDYNIIEESYWNSNNNLVNNENGVALTRRKYDGKQLKFTGLYDYKNRIIHELLSE